MASGPKWRRLDVDITLSLCIAGIAFVTLHSTPDWKNWASQLQCKRCRVFQTFFFSKTQSCTCPSNKIKCDSSSVLCMFMMYTSWAFVFGIILQMVGNLTRKVSRRFEENSVWDDNQMTWSNRLRLKPLYSEILTLIWYKHKRSQKACLAVSNKCYWEPYQHFLHLLCILHMIWIVTCMNT